MSTNKEFVCLEDRTLSVSVRLSEVVAFKLEAELLTVHLRGGLAFHISDPDVDVTDKLDAALKGSP